MFQKSRKFVELASTEDTRSKSDAEDSDDVAEEHKEIIQHVASTAKLSWNPFDGRHVEEQKPVHNLKSYFDAKEARKESTKLKRRSTAFFSKDS